MRPQLAACAVAVLGAMTTVSAEGRGASDRLLAVRAPGGTYVVAPTGGGDFTTIQQAIAVAHPGETVQVSPGIYNESEASWRGRYGREDWKAVFRTVRPGTRAAPITIKARFPARRPLAGGEWAEGRADRQSIIDAKASSGEILPACGLLLHSYVILDGFVVRNGGVKGILASPEKRGGDAARGLWIRNCVFLTSSLRRRDAENNAALSLGGWGVPECCVQNNYFETKNATALGIAGGRSGIVEYNEFVDAHNYLVYAHGGPHANDGLVIRYNCFRQRQRRPLMRIRDSLRYEVHHNLLVGFSGFYFDDHGPEHPDFPDDSYSAHHNTIVMQSGSYAIGYQRPSHPKGRERPTAYNIIAGAPSCAVNLSVWGAPFANVHITHNVIAPGIPVTGGKGLTNGTCTVADNIIADPRLDGDFRSLAFDNGTYGANLDVRMIPYRRFDGERYPFHDPHDAP